MNIFDENKPLIKSIAVGLLVLLVIMLALMVYWDSEPDLFDVKEVSQYQNQGSTDFVTGYVTTATMVEVADTLLHKRGGY
jgi:hypothetical protein